MKPPAPRGRPSWPAPPALRLRGLFQPPRRRHRAQGNYSTFEKTMTERLRNARKAAEAQDAKRKHVQSFIDRFR